MCIIELSEMNNKVFCSSDLDNKLFLLQLLILTNVIFNNRI